MLYLRETEQILYHAAYCSFTYVNMDEDIKLCASYPTFNEENLYGMNGANMCDGDSGGSLVYFNEEDRWETIGVASHSRLDSCGSYLFPGVYTRRRPFYVPWIVMKSQIYCNETPGEIPDNEEWNYCV
eukprot:UN12013